MSKEGLAPEMQKQIADSERADYFGQPETQASLEAISKQLLERQRSEAETAEIGIDSAAGREEVVEAAADNAVDAAYTYDPVTYKVTYNYGSNEEWEQAKPYVALDHMQILMDEIDQKTERGEAVSQDDADDVQALYAETSLEDPRNAYYGPETVEKLLVDTPEMRAAEGRESSPEVFEEVAQPQVKAEPQPAAQKEPEPTPVAAEAEPTQEPADPAEVEAPESAEATVEAEKSVVEVFGMHIPEPGTAGALAVPSFRQALVLKQQEYKGNAEVVDTVYRMLLVLEDLPNQKVSALQHLDLVTLARKLEDQLATKEEVVTTKETDGSAQSSVIEIGAENTNWGKVAYDAANLVADIEIAIGNSHAGPVETARYLLEQIEKAISEDPVNASGVKQAFNNLQTMHAEREAYAAQEDTSVFPNVYELQPNKAEQRREELLAPRRAKLTPEDLSEEGSVSIDSSKTTAEIEKAKQEQAQLAKEIDSLESAYSDASASEKAVQEVMQDDDSSTLVAPEEAGVAPETPQAEPETPQAEPETSRAEKTAERAEARKDEQIRSQITAIEKQEYGWLDRYFDDKASAVEVLQDRPFADFKTLISMTKPQFNQFMMLDPGREGIEELNYEILHQWGTHVDNLTKYAATLPESQRTTKNVIEGYLSEQLDMWQ